ncbi:MAG: hydroxyphenylacetyl-CoA thioesterase PaaI [Gemmatimonadetes bacterium]|nr:hydroxyphenylacetyl-CoA thioesterase PaaI [Gemmatimonadota bacterium]
MSVERAGQIVAGMMRDDAFSQWLGVEILEVAPARATIRMTVRAEMCNGFAVCHGGVTFAFADSAFAFACNTQGNVAVSIENSMTYPAAARAGDVLTAVAREATRSNRILYYHVDVTKADGTVVGLFRGTAYRTEKPHP